MKKRKIAAAIAAIVMATTTMSSFSVSASDYLLSYDSDAIKAAIALSGITPVETWNKGSYTVVDDDIEKFMDIFSDDEVAKLLTEHDKELYSNYVYTYIGTAITAGGHYTPCFIMTRDNCSLDMKNNEIWDKYDRILSWGGELHPTYYEEMINEDILPYEEYEKMSYEERIVYAINYYNEHGEYLIDLGLAEIYVPVIPLDYGKTLMGDVDMDDKITAFDAACVLTEYSVLSAGSESSLNANQKLAADVDNDGKVTAFDAAKILNYYAELAAEREPSRD